VLGAAVLLDSRGIRGAATLIDRDLDDLTGASSLYPPTVIATTGYDLMADVLAVVPDLVARSARAHALSAMQRVEADSGLPFIEAVSGLARPVLALRLINAEQSLGFKLRDFPFNQVLGSDYAPTGYLDMLELANLRSSTSHDAIHLLDPVQEASSRIESSSFCAGGHDTASAAAAILRKAGGNVGARPIEYSWMTAVNCLLLMQLSIYAALQTWAGSYGRNAFTCPQ
jgi:hypothetical protein